MVNPVVTLSRYRVVKVVCCLCHRHLTLDALQVILELLDWIILSYYFDSMLKSLALLLQFITSDCLLNQ